VLVCLALIAAGLSVLGIVLATRDDDVRPTARAADTSRPIGLKATLSPRVVLFGDTIRAQIEVTLDRDRVDPDSVRIAFDFSPWEIVARPEPTRRDGRTTTFLQSTVVLRCLADACVPPGESATLEFDPARVTYAASGEEGRRRAASEVVWPVLIVHSRLVSSDFRRTGATATAWRADTVSPPPVSYRLAPGLAVGLLLVGGGVFAVAGTALASLAVPRRGKPLTARPEEPPMPSLTPLEHALALLEGDASPNGAAARRRALELVAEELAERDTHLAQTARVLAWSEEVPVADETSELAARVRSAIKEASSEHPT
jgi:hypothetical protein